MYNILQSPDIHGSAVLPPRNAHLKGGSPPPHPPPRVVDASGLSLALTDGLGEFDYEVGGGVFQEGMRILVTSFARPIENNNIRKRAKNVCFGCISPISKKKGNVAIGAMIRKDLIILYFQYGSCPHSFRAAPSGSREAEFLRNNDAESNAKTP
ncbi:hypothetical protein CEXT_251541 [Caerostris extrusa]|uniref:Uncharacterized protein n=1 Tax=Caerostris extrusa TaxID=172846 RepID=A0AAV4NE55_CAEEX|nr:hypothetical protein CEXT_251541 [Caerostris extrusa]